MISNNARNTNAILFLKTNKAEGSPWFENYWMRSTKNRCTTSQQITAFSTLSKVEMKLPTKPGNLKLNEEENESSSMSISKIDILSKQTPKFNKSLNNTIDLNHSRESNQMISSQDSLTLKSKSTISVPFAWISNKSLWKQTNKSRQQEAKNGLRFALKFLYFRWIKDQINTTRGCKQKTQFIKVNLNDDSFSPKATLEAKENHNSSSTEIDEDSDSMNSIDEELPPKLAINKTKVTRSLCEQKGKFKIASKQVSQNSIYLNIGAKESSRSPILQFE